MTINIAGFQARYPEFDTVADARIEVYLADSQLEINESIWSDYYEKGVYALAAHMLHRSLMSESGNAGSSGEVSSKRIGDLQISYNTKSLDSTESYYNSTVYGQEYYRLMKLVAPLVTIANEDFSL